MMEPTGDTTIHQLPDEVLVEIFKNLPLETLLACELVCERWQRLARDPDVWNYIPVVYSEQDKNSDAYQKVLDILSSHWSYIRYIKLRFVGDYSRIITVLKPCINIVKLELAMCRVDDRFATDLKMWPNLRMLHFPITLQRMPPTNYDFRYDHHPKLTSLSVPNFAVDQNNFNTILKCKQLSHIFLPNVTSLTKEDVTNMLITFKNIVRSFHVHGSDTVDDEVFELIGKCSLLEDLAIIRCENLTDNALLHLNFLRNLERLQLWNNEHFTSIGLLNFFVNPIFYSMTHLSFSRVKNITPDAIDVISVNYKRLKFVAFHQCPLIANVDYNNEMKSKFRYLDVPKN